MNCTSMACLTLNASLNTTLSPLELDSADIHGEWKEFKIFMSTYMQVITG